MEMQQFINEIGKKMQDYMCDLFIGSGMSAPSNLPTWRSFLDPYLKEIGLELMDGDDLPLVAQYIVNRNTGNRNIISEAVYNTFGKEYPLNEYHLAIANMRIRTVWTTNYDCLIEKAFVDRNMRVIISEDTFLHPHSKADLEIIKIHGCVTTAAKGIVLTRADYDNFIYEKPKIAHKLRETIINKSIFS